MTKYKAYPEYKDSGVEWLGEVPKDWNILSLKSIALIVNGSTPKSGVEEYWDGDINWITPTDLSQTSDIYINDSQRKITYQGLNSCGTSLVPEDTVILSTRAPIGSLAITTIQSCTNQGCKSLVVKNKIYSLFLYYYLSMSTNPLNNLGRGSTFLELSTEDLGSFKVSIPDIGIEKIVTFLSYETAKIDNLIEKQQQLIELLKEKRQAVISHAVTKGLNPDVPMKDSGVEWLGEVPEHWEVKRIKHFGKVIGGFAFKSSDFTEEGYPVIKISNVSNFSFDWGDTSFLPNYFSVTHKEYCAPNEALIFAMTRPIIAGGIKVALLENDNHPLINQRVGFMSVNNGEIAKYILFSTQSSGFLAQFLNNITVTNQPNISSEGIESIYLPIPSGSEVNNILHYIEKIDECYRALIDKVLMQVFLLRERRTALISAAVTGKIDVRDWVAPDTQEIEKTEETAA